MSLAELTITTPRRVEPAQVQVPVDFTRIWGGHGSRKTSLFALFPAGTPIVPYT
jgi:hypothetical protein